MGQNKTIETYLFSFIVTYGGNQGKLISIHLSSVPPYVCMTTVMQGLHVWQFTICVLFLNGCYIYYFHVTRYQVYEFTKGRRSIKFVMVCPISWAVSLFLGKLRSERFGKNNLHTSMIEVLMKSE